MDAVNRTFVGILVPPPVAGLIYEAALQIRRKPAGDQVRWSSPGEYMIQLASLGELGVQTLASLKQVLPQAAQRFDRMSLRLSGFVGVPSMLQPRFVCVAVAGDQRLDQLAQALDVSAALYVPYRDVRGFRPHIVAGRLKSESESLRVSLGRTLKTTPIQEFGTIEVDSAALLVSQADASGVGYQIIERLPLAPG